MTGFSRAFAIEFVAMIVGTYRPALNIRHDQIDKLVYGLQRMDKFTTEDVVSAFVRDSVEIYSRNNNEARDQATEAAETLASPPPSWWEGDTPPRFDISDAEGRQLRAYERMWPVGLYLVRLELEEVFDPRTGGLERRPQKIFLNDDEIDLDSVPGIVGALHSMSAAISAGGE